MPSGARRAGPDRGAVPAEDEVEVDVLVVGAHDARVEKGDAVVQVDGEDAAVGRRMGDEGAAPPRRRRACC